MSSATPQPVRVLFVCLGNICRSPLAEAVFRQLVERRGLETRFEIDSAGTSDWHIGERPDERTTREAQRRGVLLTGHARQIRDVDIERFDYIVVMDDANERDVRRLAEQIRPDAPIHRLRSFDSEARSDMNVPDPFFGGSSGFARTHDIIERACHGLLERIRSERGL
jgi:low molecular weight protein-tyrosine phosphatase